MARPSLLDIKRFFRAASQGRHSESRASGKLAGRVIGLGHALLSERGEVSGARLAKDAVAAYRALDPDGLRVFFDLLVEQFSPDPEEVERCASAYRDEPSQANLIALQHAVEPPRQELFRRLNMAPGGTGVLVDMRGWLLNEIGANPQWTRRRSPRDRRTVGSWTPAPCSCQEPVP